MILYVGELGYIISSVTLDSERSSRMVPQQEQYERHKKRPTQVNEEIHSFIYKDWAGSHIIPGTWNLTYF